MAIVTAGRAAERHGRPIGQGAEWRGPWQAVGATGGDWSG